MKFFADDTKILKGHRIFSGHNRKPRRHQQITKMVIRMATSTQHRFKCIHYGKIIRITLMLSATLISHWGPEKGRWNTFDPSLEFQIHIKMISKANSIICLIKKLFKSSTLQISIFCTKLLLDQILNIALSSAFHYTKPTTKKSNMCREEHLN